MKNNWKRHEINSVNNLNEKFGHYATFSLIGGSDSTKPDIEVKTTNGKLTAMEAKKCPAQCGQFVAFYDDAIKSFIYSESNKTPIDNNIRKILNHMNAYPEKYKNCGTKGCTIDMDEAVFLNRIIDYYKNKGVTHFILNEHHIVPVEKIGDYVTIIGKYRAKGSGSSSVGKRNAENVFKHIISYGYKIDNKEIKNQKFFVHSKTNLDKETFFFENNKYMFSKRENAYEVRKLSKTSNPTVIFTLKLKPNVEGISDAEFISDLSCIS